jgi:ABC-type branched-subunit amino acid transport system ATPase component
VVEWSRRDPAQETTGETAPLALECRGLTYRFGSHTAVGDVDLAVRSGEVFGLLGPNGAGKTTTIRSARTQQAAAEPVASGRSQPTELY